MKVMNRKLKYVCIVLPSLILCALVFGKYIHYTIADDYLLNFVSMGGTSGVANEHLIFVNAIIGYMAKALYSIWSSVNWYGALYLLLILLCAYSLLYILNKYTSFIKAVVISILIELFMLFFASFTILAYICMGVAFVGYIDYITVKKDKNKWVQMIGIIILFIFGYMMRSGALFSFILLGIPLLVFSGKEIEKKVLLS